ncbi:hypothetical protein EV702DRAFT_971282 [Suillus placidus]|uniref:Mating-type protein C-terminal domain-containing protein n=1 Tax=Suillus placidus TaxID=48579 RepID=A0A9P6ZTJ2_9AGAM|nr:hypothetical protein EV702DRAFT_971282 [Suillus placidus]
MFKFIRRVSSSFLPRPDRPWRDDATSNAPTIGRKRRFSFVDDDDDDSASTSVKKIRGDSTQAEGSTLPIPAVSDKKEGEDVKSVTQGVKDVELDEKKLDSSFGPEEVPLPDSPGRTPQLDTPSIEAAASTASEEEADKKDAQDDSDADSVASSSEVILDEGQPEDDSKDDTKTLSTSAAEDAPITEGTPIADDTPAVTETEV